MHIYKPVRWTLENGMVFHGQSFGAEKATSGKVVFNTAMVGYHPCLADLSHEGQISTSTYPIIGNYGVPAHGETDGISDFFAPERVNLNPHINKSANHQINKSFHGQIN